MATVKHALKADEAQFLASTFPQLVHNNGTAFPVIGLAYDASTEEKGYWNFKASNYGSGNLTLVLRWYADTASSGDVMWGCKLAAITPDTDTQDVETKSLATQQTVTDSHLGTTAQRLHTCSITVSNLDSVAADDECWLEISRVAANGADTMTGDAILVDAELQYSDT